MRRSPAGVPRTDAPEYPRGDRREPPASTPDRREVRMNIGRPERIIQVEPIALPVPEVLPEPQPDPDPERVEPSR